MNEFTKIQVGLPLKKIFNPQQLLYRKIKRMGFPLLKKSDVELSKIEDNNWVLRRYKTEKAEEGIVEINNQFMEFASERKQQLPHLPTRKDRSVQILGSSREKTPKKHSILVRKKIFPKLDSIKKIQNDGQNIQNQLKWSQCKIKLTNQEPITFYPKKWCQYKQI